MTEFQPEVPKHRKKRKKNKGAKKADHKHEYDYYYRPFDDTFDGIMAGLSKYDKKRLEEGRSIFGTEIKVCRICGKEDKDFKYLPPEKFEGYY